MAQLKTRDGTPKPEPTCFKYGDSARLGFTFELGKKDEIFAPHSFLSRIELKDGDEIAFHYTYGIVRVTGCKLDKIFGQIKGQSVGILRRSEPDDPCREEIEIREIVFEEAMAREMDKLL